MTMSGNTVQTVDDPRDNSNDAALARFIIWGLLFLVTPLTVITSVIVYALFVYVRIKRSVIVVFSAPIILATFIFGGNTFGNFISSFQHVPEIFGGDFGTIFTILALQAPVSVSLGILLGLAFASWKWFKRSRWETHKFRKAPWEILRMRKTIKEIQLDLNGPDNGMTLGVNNDGNRVIQTYEEASAHTFIVGGSGSGKTQTAIMRIRDQIQNGDGICIVDLKNDPDFVNKVKLFADRYGRKFQHFTLQDISQPYLGPAPEGPAHYDPLSKGDWTRRADMILDLRDWTNADYFKKNTQAYLQLLFAVIINNPNPNISTLEDAVTLMDPKELQRRAQPLATNENFRSFVSSIDQLNDTKLSQNIRENLQTNRSQLEIYLQSIAGPWLRLDKGGNNIDIEEAARNGDIVFFSLDSLAYGSLAAHLANLIIQDLKTISSSLLTNKAQRPFHVFIDEFSAIGSDNIIGLLNKARASNMSISLATQTLADLMTKDPSLKGQLMGIVSSFLIHRANTHEDSEVYSGLTGTEKVFKAVENIEQNKDLFGLNTGRATQSGRVEEIEQWQIMPTEIQKLRVGEMFYINTSNQRTSRSEKVQCILEDTDRVENTTQTRPKTTPTITIEETPTPTNYTQTDFTLNPQHGGNNPHINTTDFQPLSPEPQPAQQGETGMAQKSNKPPMNEDGKPSTNPNDYKKVAINYALLGKVFNDKAELHQQHQRDIKDGVYGTPQPQQPVSAPPQAPPQPAHGTELPQTPTVLPVSPFLPKIAPKVEPESGSKDAFDF